MDNLRLITFYDKFFVRDEFMTDETYELKDRCMQWAHMSNYTLCGTLKPKEFDPSPYEGNKDEEIRAYLDWARVDFRKVKLISFAEDPEIPFKYDEKIDPRTIYIADSGNHCIRRIYVK